MIFTTFTPIEIIMGLRESCIPMNQPLIPIVISMAGAPHTHM